MAHDVRSILTLEGWFQVWQGHPRKIFLLWENWCHRANVDDERADDDGKGHGRRPPSSLLQLPVHLRGIRAPVLVDRAFEALVGTRRELPHGLCKGSRRVSRSDLALAIRVSRILNPPTPNLTAPNHGSYSFPVSSSKRPTQTKANSK